MTTKQQLREAGWMQATEGHWIKTARQHNDPQTGQRDLPPPPTGHETGDCLARGAISHRQPVAGNGPQNEAAPAAAAANMKYNPKIVLAWFAECGLPAPELEHVFHPNRKFRLDFAWPAFKVCLEVDGGIWARGSHGRGSGIARDMEKQNLAVALGWRPLRVQPAGLCTQETVDLVKAVLQLAAPPLTHGDFDENQSKAEAVRGGV